MTTEFPYDVFLSHNSVDKPRVRRLAERLRTEMNPLPTPVKTSAFSLLPSAFPAMLCLSAAALGSDWVGLERSTIGMGNLPFRDPANADRRIIPLLLTDCKLSDTLRRGENEDLSQTRDFLLAPVLSGDVALAA